MQFANSRGARPALVTADSGYAYSKVYGALERRGVAALIPGEGRALAEPCSLAPVSLRRTKRHREVSSRKDTESPADQRSGGATMVRRPAIARASAPFAVGRGGAADVPAPYVAFGGQPRRGEDLARASCPSPRDPPYRPLPKPGYSTTPKMFTLNKAKMSA